MTLREKVAEAIDRKIATNKRKQVIHVYVPLIGDEDKEPLVLFQDEVDNGVLAFERRVFYNGFLTWKHHWNVAREQTLDNLMKHR